MLYALTLNAGVRESANFGQTHYAVISTAHVHSRQYQPISRMQNRRALVQGTSYYENSRYRMDAHMRRWIQFCSSCLVRSSQCA